VPAELILLDARVDDALLVQALFPAVQSLAACDVKPHVVEADPGRVKRSSLRVPGCVRKPNMIAGEAQMVSGPTASSPDMMISASKSRP
jgi:hypothetical protein